MTTTAAAWRHVKHSIAVEGCAVVQRPSSWMCGCTTPTPGPASPCAVCWKDKASSWHPKNADPWSHEFMAMKGEPTRCTCGHPLEAVR